ncbi:MAG: Ig-like domain-containing protein [Bryobacteraceae bacterium]|nr:Ig-like domain-containing protein [Bryobacteraceae bacterium]
MRRGTLQTIARAASLAAAVACGLPSAFAQLNQSCTVSVLNRTVPVGPDGRWVLPNVPANFGQVKARATCLQNGVTVFGESDFFTIPPNGAVNLPAITLGSATPIPSSLTIAPASVSLTTLGQTAQLIVTAQYPNGSTRNVTAASTGTNYTISNPAIATITAGGLLTAVSNGTVVIQANNDGATGIITATVLVGGATVGGIPVSWLVANGLNPTDPIVHLLDTDRDDLTNLQEFQSGTDPNKPDTDADGLRDGDEVNRHKSSPLLTDTDGDRIPDGVEVQNATNPADRNSYDLQKAVATSTLTPPSFALKTSIATPVASIQLNWRVSLIDGKTTLDLTADPRTSYTSSDLNVCNFGGQPGLVFSGSAGNCVITIRQSTLVAPVPGTVSAFTPVEISTLNVPGAVAVDVAGNFAYVAAGNSGVTVVDLSNRAQPVARGTLGGLGNVQAVRAVGQTVFAADSGGSLRVLNVQNPNALVPLTSLAIPGNPVSLTLRGSTLAVAAQSGGVSLVNVSNPAAPAIIRTFATPGPALGFDFDEVTGIAAVAMGTSGLQMADISNPGSPRLRGLLPGGDVRRVLLKLPAALLADAQRSFTSAHVGNPDSPVISASLRADLGGAPVDVAGFGDIAITADVSFGRAVPLVNTSAPLNPASVGFWTLLSPGFSSSVAVDNSYGYLVIPATGTLRILKYQDIVDTGGKPPAVQITFPTPATTLIRGQQTTVTATADDDVAVASVNFTVNGLTIGTPTGTPYRASYAVPVSATTLTFGATATDFGNNVGVAANIVVPVIADPMTTAIGRVVDAQNLPVAGAAVSSFGVSATSSGNGTFSIPGLPTIRGPVVVSARATVNNILNGGESAASPPVPGGATNVGDVRVLPIPVITSVQPRTALANTAIPKLVVTGARLTNANFSVLPSPSPITLAVTSIAADGASAELTAAIAPAASGQFVIVATTTAGSSDAAPSAGNTITVYNLSPSDDTDNDGLPNALEVTLGTDPVTGDTDGDGYNDAVEVATGSDPTKASSTPLNSRISGNVISNTAAVTNFAASAASPSAAVSRPLTLLNLRPTAQSPTEANSRPFSLLALAPRANSPAEAGTIPVSVLNAPLTIVLEANSILFSICNATLGPAACANYSGLKVASPSVPLAPTESPTTAEETNTAAKPGPERDAAFTVLAVAPRHRASTVAPASPIMLAFSHALDPSSIQPAHFTVAAGDVALTPEIRYSSDLRTVTLLANLPAATPIRVRVGSGLRDISGHELEEFESEFQTAPQSPANAASVIAHRSGPSLHFTLTRPVTEGWLTAACEVFASVDDDGVKGTFRQSGQQVEFVPERPFRPGAAVQLLVKAVGEPTHERLFLIPSEDAAGVPATPSRIAPGRRTRNTDAILEVEYDRALDASSVNSSSVTLIDATTGQQAPAEIRLRGDRTVHVTPTPPLLPESQYLLKVSSSVTDTTGRPVNPHEQAVSTGNERVSGTPALLAESPAQGTPLSSGAQEIRLTFDRPINLLTAGPQSISVTQGGNPLPFSLQFADGGRTVYVLVQEPPRAASQLELNLTGLEDTAGNVIPAVSLRYPISIARQGNQSIPSFVRRLLRALPGEGGPGTTASLSSRR